MDEYLLKAGTVIVGDGTKLMDTAIQIHGEKIIAVGNDITPNSQTKILDFSDRVVMPGIIDPHVHVYHDGSPDPKELGTKADEYIALRATKFTKIMLEHGITTIGDAGCAGDVSLALSLAIKDGFAIGPRLLVSGAMITITGGRDKIFRPSQADGPDDVRRATRAEIARGVDYIKLAATGAISSTKTESMSAQFTIPEMQAAVEEAHKVGKKVHAHAYGDVGIENTILAGVDVLVHGHPISKKNIDLMKQHGTLYMPTFVTYYESQLHHDEGLLPDYMIRKEKELFPLMEEGMRNAIKAGVEVVLGSDSGLPYTPFGKSSPQEMDLLVKYGGMSEMDAIVAGTLNAARSLNIESSTGTVNSGKSADILILKEGMNPLEDISILQEPSNLECIFLKGNRVK